MLLCRRTYDESELSVGSGDALNELIGLRDLLEVRGVGRNDPPADLVRRRSRGSDSITHLRSFQAELLTLPPRKSASLLARVSCFSWGLRSAPERNATISAYVQESVSI